MARFGIVQRRALGDKPPLEVEYVLTAFGLRFMGILDELRRLQDAVDQGDLAESRPSEKEPRSSEQLTSSS